MKSKSSSKKSIDVAVSVASVTNEGLKQMLTMSAELMVPPGNGQHLIIPKFTKLVEKFKLRLRGYAFCPSFCFDRVI